MAHNRRYIQEDVYRPYTRWERYKNTVSYIWEAVCEAFAHVLPMRGRWDTKIIEVYPGDPRFEKASYEECIITPDKPFFI